jgi:hypothetical protein
MAALDTVGDYLTETRVLLQDTRVPYRYPDADIVSALNIGLQEAYRLRADLFLSDLSFDVPAFSASALTTTVPFEIGFRQSLVYYMVGRIQLRDQEDSTDQRAGALLQKFVGQMLTIAS